MKILHIINTLEIGGAQSVLAQLLEGWGEEKDQHMVVSLKHREPLSARIEAINIPVEHINLLPHQIEPAKFLKLIRIIQRYKPDIVQTWLYHSDLIGGIAVRLASQAPIIWGIHHTITSRNSVKPFTWAIIQLLSLFSKFLPSHIICCSHSAYQTHVACGYDKSKMTTILNGVNTERFQPDTIAYATVRTELGFSPQTKLIGMFARYHPQKDHDTFIDAANILLKKNPDVHFVLSGEEIDYSNKHLHDKIFKEGIQENIHLIGSRQDMPRLNAGMNIVTLSSSYGEALPMSICEAMSCAIPCVATNVGDLSTLIGKTGLIVEPGDPQALANAWQNMLEYSDMEYNYLGSQARERILNAYNLTNMVKKYKAIYQELRLSQ